MRPLALSSFLLGLLIFYVPAHAEGNCPPGHYPIGGQGVQGCATIPNYDQQQSQAPATPMRWESRWGAIYTDANKGVAGSSTDKSGREQARKAALEDCITKGGTRCKYAISYSNSCGAMVAGDNWFNVESGVTEDEAIQAGMNACKKDKDTNCHIYMTTCSPAARVQ